MQRCARHTRPAALIGRTQVQWPGADDGLKQDREIAGARHRRAVRYSRNAVRRATSSALRRAPNPRQSRSKRRARPHVLAALMIMRRGRQHRMRKLGRALLHVSMELGGRSSEPARVEADVVARDQPAVAIEGGILDRLGAKRRAQLLKAGQRDILLAGHCLRIGSRPGEPIAEHLDQPAVARQARRLGARDGLRQESAIGRRCVDRPGHRSDRPESGREFRSRPGESRRREYRGLRDRFARCHKAHRHNASRCAEKLRSRIWRRASSSSAVEVAGPAADTLPQSPQRLLAGGVVLKRVHLVHEIVAGGAVGLPAAGRASRREPEFSRQ